MAHKRSLILCSAVLSLLIASTAHAHWCNDLWASRYSIVVRPVNDTLNVPSSGSATLAVFVQNNMGYPLISFNLSASASNFNISVSSETPKVSNFLFPGEKLRHFLEVSRTGSASVLDVEDISFNVTFGLSSPNQDGSYGGTGRDVMMKKANGNIYPSRTVSDLQGSNYQAEQLHLQNEANYGNLSTAISNLMSLYCAGRGSYGTDGYPISSHCPNDTTTTCPSRATRGDTKYDWQHLWAAGEIAIRKNSLSAAQRTAFRERLVCGFDDNQEGFQAFSILLMGYMGNDSTTRTFLENLASSGSSDEQVMANAALFMMGDTQREATVIAGMSGGSTFAQITAAAALAITNGDDTAVDNELIPRAGWAQPETGTGLEYTAAHMINIVAWDRRGWAIDAGDVGAVSFYETIVDTTPPAAPTNASCNINGTDIRLSWNQVTQDENSNPETINFYRVYWGTTANSCPSTCTRPGMGFDYDHVDQTSSVYFDPSPLTAGSTYYLTVAAVDTAGNQSVFATEVNCVAPIPDQPPNAVISCSPTSGDAPLSVTCNGDSSTDPNSDIANYYFQLNAEPEQQGNPTTFNNLDPGTHTITLRVVDGASLEDTDSETINVNDVTSPVITHTPIADGQQENVDVTVNAMVTDDFSNISAVELHYRVVGAGSFTMSAMNSSGSNYDDTIPAASVTTAGVEYYLRAEDAAGNEVFSPAGGSGSPNSFTVTQNDTSGPSITHSPIADGQAPDQAVQIDATISDPSGVGTVNLHYRTSGGSWNTDPMTDQGSNAYQGSIPATEVQTPGVEYYIDAVDQATTPNASQLPTQGQAGPFTFTVVVVVNQAPNAVASANPTSGLAPLAVTFDGSASDDPDNNNITFSWDFDDSGSNSTDTNPNHTFNSAGTYDVELTVTDDGSPVETDTDTVRITVTDPQNAPPDLSTASATPLFGEPPLIVSFDASGVTDPEGHNFTVEWNFDDTTTSSELTVDHTFTEARVYNVTLNAQDDGTPTVPPSTRTFQINVSASNRPPSVAAVSVAPLSGDPPLEVTFDASGATDPDGDNLIIGWMVTTLEGNQVFTSSSRTDTHTFETGGTFEVRLTATDDGSPALQATKDFTISVTIPGVTDAGTSTSAPVRFLRENSDISGQCGCSNTGRTTTSWSWLLLFALPLLRLRKS